MSGTDSGEWFADSDGQWTWRQPDGTCWRQSADGAWHELAAEAIGVPSHDETVGSLPGAGLPGAGAAVSHIESPHFGFQQFGAAPPSPPHPGPPPPAAVSPGANIETGHLPPLAGGALPVGPSAAGVTGAPAGSPVHAGADPTQWHLGESQGNGHGGEPSYPGAAPYRPATSAMAIWALILAVFPPFCYINNLFGVVLGLEARHHIKHSGGVLRGKTPALIAIIFGMAWLATIPFVIEVVVSNGSNLIHSAKTTAEDGAAKGALDAARAGINDIYNDNGHSYASIPVSAIPSIPLVHFSATCARSTICYANGGGFGYTYFQMCEETGTDHAWIVSMTSTAPSWYGEANGDCPLLGNPGSAAGTPVESAAWRQNGFPPVTFDVKLFGHSYNWKL